MRVSDDRYQRDRLRLDLALRFIQHAARTQTIRAWTGLTEDRIRKLYRSYLQQPGRAPLNRPRGRSPRQAAFFVRSPRLQHESAMLASACTLLGALAPRPLARGPLTNGQLPSALREPPRDARRGLLLCQAYETYRMLLPTGRISFEHLVYLVSALARGDELKLSECCACGALLVTERITLAPPRCLYCSAEESPGECPHC